MSTTDFIIDNYINAQWLYINNADNSARYALGKVVDISQPTLIVFGINPSTAEPDCLLYYDSALFGGIYDDRMLVKIVPTNKEYGLQENIPYDGAKPMYLVDCVDDMELLKEIVIATSNGLPKKK